MQLNLQSYEVTHCDASANRGATDSKQKRGCWKTPVAKLQNARRCTDAPMQNMCIYTNPPCIYIHYDNNKLAQALGCHQSTHWLAVYRTSRDQSDLVSRYLALRARATIQYLRISLVGILVASHPKRLSWWAMNGTSWPNASCEIHTTETAFGLFRPYITQNKHLCVVPAPLLHPSEWNHMFQPTKVTYYQTTLTSERCFGESIWDELLLQSMQQPH